MDTKVRIPEMHMNFASRSDLIEASKAIRDDVSSSLALRIQAEVDTRVAAMEERITTLEATVQQSLDTIMELLKKLSQSRTKEISYDQQGRPSIIREKEGS